jgi:uncharacterized protein YqgC (DUF456 family)
MSWFEIIMFIIALMLMIVGMAGIILPLLPGVPIIFAAALLYGVATGFAQVTGQVILIFAILTAISLLLDWLATVIGVRKMGGSYLGMLGAFIGMIAGLLLPGVGIFGFIIGAFIGAVLFELLIGKTSKQAMRAGLGSFIGFLIGGVLRFAIGAVMIGIFIYRVLF